MSNPEEQPADGSTAFTIAATVLGLIACAQVAAVIWFISTVENKNTANDGRPTVTDTSQERLESAASTNPGPVAAAPEAPRINRTHSIANIPTIDPATVTPPAVDDQTSGGVGEEIAVTNKAALFYLDQGMALRNDGDMQGALVHFNSAASLEKDHPRILYEFAVTYEEMGLSEKAANFWKSIYQMGRVLGGDYYSLADFRLKGHAPAVDHLNVPVITPTNVAQKKIMEIASAVAEPDDTVAEGERVVLNVLIKSSPNTTIKPEYVHVRVDFYDKVNEDMVDLTRAVPANRWVTQPVDWHNESEELLEVTYFLPPQIDQEILDFGHRAYHGYVVKVYYHDQLQDALAEPATLLESVDFGSPLQNQTPPVDESFFPR